jgi:hypothetical protein
MNVAARARKPLWIRIGTDAPADNAEAKLSVLDGARTLVVDGGPGGYDPTSGGPGGGFPSYCLKSDPAHAKITGKPLDGKPKSLNRRPTIALTLTVRRSSACDVQLELVGPRGHVYGRGQAIALRGKRVVRLRRVRGLVRGGYRLRVTAVSQRDERVRVPTDLRGRLHG